MSEQGLKPMKSLLEFKHFNESATFERITSHFQEVHMLDSLGAGHSRFKQLLAGSGAN